jgi:hypothetical protein
MERISRAFTASGIAPLPLVEEPSDHASESAFAAPPPPPVDLTRSVAGGRTVAIGFALIALLIICYVCGRQLLARCLGRRAAPPAGTPNTRLVTMTSADLNPVIELVAADAHRSTSSSQVQLQERLDGSGAVPMLQTGCRQRSGTEMD